MWVLKRSRPVYCSDLFSMFTAVGCIVAETGRSFNIKNVQCLPLSPPIIRALLAEIDVYLPLFSAHSYLEFAGHITSSLAIVADIEIVFRASSDDGLLLFSGGPPMTLTL